ncbi:MAG TPA: GTP cyclohydrolase I FolE [Bryobacteraceae bacterium]|jgi:GTP cyclohydrolase IA|nr:GTP cyclohydrolase I FolE [Bryobacteraceae bacterium]
MSKHKRVVKMPLELATETSFAPEIRRILEHLVVDPDREGLARTPERVEKAMRFLTSGYRTDLRRVVNGALFAVKYDEMVIVKDIEFFSLCEHHLLPFYGKVHVAYLPKGHVIGLSKIPRIVDVFARRLQIQERMTQEIAQTIQNLIDPVGVGVICEARHFCMMMRGVEKQHSGAVTSAMLGAFRNRKTTRDEFLALVGQRLG